MSLSTRITKLEVRAGKVATAPLPDDIGDVGLFLSAYVEMIDAFPAYYAEVRQRRIEEIEGYERRLAANTDYPGVVQGIEAKVREYRYEIALQDAVYALLTADRVGLNVETATAEFKAIRGNNSLDSVLLDLCGAPNQDRCPESADHPACERVRSFWEWFWYGR